MKVGIVGSGTVAQTLALGLSERDYSIMMGTRDPAALSGRLPAGTGIRVATPDETAQFADLAILAVKGTAALSVLQEVKYALSGKTLIDTTNPIADAAAQDGVLEFFTGPNESLFETLQAAAPDVSMVKAFNSVGAGQMIAPQYETGTPTMFIAGDDSVAKDQVSTLLKDVGWEVADMGTHRAARAIEPLCMLWCIPGLRENSWTHAFKLLR
ncbi:MAG: NADPH-dependent F420 reductase [Burkholderiaceae bacterium]